MLAYFHPAFGMNQDQSHAVQCKCNTWHFHRDDQILLLNFRKMTHRCCINQRNTEHFQMFDLNRMDMWFHLKRFFYRLVNLTELQKIRLQISWFMIAKNIQDRINLGFWDRSKRSICRCNLAIENASSNNSLFGNVGDRSFAASVTDIIKVNFSDVNICLIVGSKIRPTIDVSVLCNDLTFEIFNFS